MLKSIVCTYPDFRTLPKGLKQLLVASENLFFNEISAAVAQSMGRNVEHNRARPWQKPTRRFNTEEFGIGA
jgi:hypothetical protein